jgi:hypothetical protein
MSVKGRRYHPAMELLEREAFLEALDGFLAARFNFWHPDLVTLHVWLWYPNPDGLYSGTNPRVRPFNKG